MEKELKKILNKPAIYYKNRIIKKNKKFNFKEPVILFGAAKMGLMYKELCKKNNIKVIAFCDNNRNKSNTYLRNTLVINPNTLRNFFNKNIQIIITSLYDENIKRQLYKLGFKNVWSHVFFSTLFAQKFPVLCWTNNINNIIKSKAKILRCFSLFYDTYSKKTFLEVLKYRLTLDRSHLSKIYSDLKNIYFDKDIINLTKNEVFLDGGAYDGDTLKPFLKTTNRLFKKILCFEPDIQSYSNLKKYVKITLKDSRIVILKEGLGKIKDTVSFTNEGNLQSKISMAGEEKINIVPIDSYIKEDFTFIKLDIEGYEKEALLGAKKAIKKTKPKLAICSYHYLEDLWSIPLLIKKLNPNYKIYLRHYGKFVFDSICYAV